jgi:hypothetical protein
MSAPVVNGSSRGFVLLCREVEPVEAALHIARGRIDDGEDRVERKSLAAVSESMTTATNCSRRTIRSSAQILDESVGKGSCGDGRDPGVQPCADKKR